jgi:hypothetical protein
MKLFSRADVHYCNVLPCSSAPFLLDLSQAIDIRSVALSLSKAILLLSIGRIAAAVLRSAMVSGNLLHWLGEAFKFNACRDCPGLNSFTKLVLLEGSSCRSRMSQISPLRVQYEFMLLWYRLTGFCRLAPYSIHIQWGLFDFLKPPRREGLVEHHPDAEN